MDCLSLNVKDVGMVDPKSKQPWAGGSLFRKYLLNRCQEDLERVWKELETTTNAAAVKETEDNDKPAEMFSDEYYTAQKAKVTLLTFFRLGMRLKRESDSAEQRRGLGLVRFIGELYKLNMLTSNIIHECVHRLLYSFENPEEEDIKSLCRLIFTIGMQRSPSSAGTRNIRTAKLSTTTLSGSSKSSSARSSRPGFAS